MSPPPQGFISHLREAGYHSRSNKHSNALGYAVVGDLIARCPAIASKAASGELVFELNHRLRVAVTDWNVDLVLGQPPEPVPPSGAISELTPATVHIAVEFKSVMTEHRKAVKNRKRDLEAHHEHVHHYSNRAIAAGILVINAADRFRSPLRTDEITTHRDPARLVEHCIRELRSVSTRQGMAGSGLEAKCALVVVCDNTEHAATRYADPPLAPAVGDPIQYDGFIQTICSAYRERFAD